MNNTYKKYTAGVYCMQSDNADYQHNDSAIITTKRGKEISVIVWKKLFSKGDFTYYSVIREDGYNRAAHLRKKADKRLDQAARQKRLSDECYVKSNKDRDFLVLGEPIKIGHHSEKRHRKAYEDANKYMGKSVFASDRAKELKSKAETLAYNAESQINLDTPESLELLKERVTYLENQREEIKSRPHQSYQLSNLGANIRRYKERLETAKKLWDLEHDNTQLTEKQIRAKKKEEKAKAREKLLDDCGVIWAFNNEQFEKNKQPDVDYVSIGMGGYCPKENIKRLTQNL